MKVISYAETLQSVVSLAGQEYSQLNTSDETAFREGFNRAIEIAWSAYPWPRLLLSHEEDIDADDKTFELNDDREDLLGVYTDDPITAIRPYKIDYTITGDLVRVENDTLESVWTLYRKPVLQFTGLDYAVGTTYAAGDQVAYVDEYYRCILASTGNAPTDATYWERLQIPYGWKMILVYYSYADYLEGDGQTDKATNYRGLATGAINSEMDKVYRQQNQFKPATIVPYKPTSRYV